MLEDFLLDCKLRGLSPQTIDTYRRHLKTFFSGYEEVTQTTINQYVLKMMDGDLSRFTVASRARSLQAFVAWASTENLINKCRVRIPRLPRLHKSVLNREAIDILEFTAEEERDKVIIRTFADTGVRLSELTNMSIEDLVERSGRFYAKVHGKGDKDRDVPLTPKLHRRLRSLQRSGRIFRSKRKPHGPLTIRAVQKIVKLIGISALGIEIHPHLFRHSFITHQIQQGMNAVLLAKVVGHEDLTMIMRVYNQAQSEDAHDAMMKNLS